MADLQDNEEKHPARRNAVGQTASVLTPEKRLRMIVLGASGVGKTQLVSRFLGRPFNPCYLPTAEEFHRTMYMIRGRTYQLDILDTSGRTMSPVMQNLTLLTGDLFLVVYSAVDRGSWERAKELVSQIEEVTRDPGRTNKCIERSFKNLLFRSAIKSENFTNGIQEKSKSSKKMSPIPVAVVASKCDLCSDKNSDLERRNVLEWIRQQSASSSSQVHHFEASAKTDVNVSTLFDKLFSMSHLPCEFSPSLHRKVPEDVYSSKSSGVNMRTKHPVLKEARPRSADFRNVHRRQSMTKKTVHLREEPGCRSSGSSWSYSSSDDEEQIGKSTKAIATICSNQRRPSVETEVLLAFTKVRSYSPETQSKRRHDTRHLSTLGKLKQRIKVKFPPR